MSASRAPVGEKKSVPVSDQGRAAALTSSAAGSKTAMEAVSAHASTDLNDEYEGQSEHDGMSLPGSHDESEDRLNELEALEDDSFPNPFTSPIQCPKKLFSIIDEYFFNNVVNKFLLEEEAESRKNLRFAAQKFGQFLGVIAGAGSIFVSVLFAPFIFFGALPIKDTNKAFTFALVTSVLLGIAFIAAPYALPAVLTWLSNLSFLGIGSFFSNVIVPTWGPQLSLLTGTTFGLTTLGSPAATIGAAILGAGFFPYVLPLAVAFFTLKCFLMPVANEVLLPLAKQAYAFIRGLCGYKDDHAKDPEKKPAAKQKTLGQASQQQRPGKPSSKQKRAAHIADDTLPVSIDSQYNGKFKWQREQLVYCATVNGKEQRFTGKVVMLDNDECFELKVTGDTIRISYPNSSLSLGLDSDAGPSARLTQRLPRDRALDDAALQQAALPKAEQKEKAEKKSDAPTLGTVAVVSNALGITPGPTATPAPAAANVKDEGRQQQAPAPSAAKGNSRGNRNRRRGGRGE